MTYIRNRNFSGTKGEKLRVTAKDEHFSSCSLAEEKSWEKKRTVNLMINMLYGTVSKA